ncbi:MAG: hypothetical protein JWN87_3064 [Frankiales bacterium]|jgi:hypothetical protein|nr:hypothetical protein [Frankiales bacterium]
MQEHGRKNRFLPARRWQDVGVRRRAGWVVGLTLAAALTGCGGGTPQTLPLCTAGSVVLTPEQTANAATIAAVGKRLGMPNHAVTVALATAFQESRLRNLDYGDRDSLGLFQQRPSQGWGSPARVRTPRLAAASFYTHLRRVPGWRSMPVTEAAQRVQRSAFPDAYAQWEDAARELARALTGEVHAGLVCQFAPAPKPGAGPALQTAALADLGPGGLARVRTPAIAWSTASWLVAHARSYGVSSVGLAGQRWEAKRGSWQADTAARDLTWS